ncbi:MAG: polysaccharide biosynthesis tyrosine autokinase [Ruminococcaceae bacterium]|nr:polysaccharide biosynthesis tyrosine autokinase [Oscillospiraceae bacterium]
MENKNLEKEITFADLWKVFKKSIVFMLIAAVLFGSVGVAYSLLIDEPEYKATATFWVNNTSSDYDYTSQAQTSAAVSIASSCVYLASTDIVVRRAVQDYDLTNKLKSKGEDACVKEVMKMINARQVDKETVIFSVTVTSDHRVKTFEVINAIQGVMPLVPPELLGLKQNEDNAPMIALIGPVTGLAAVSEVKTSAAVVAIICAFVGALAVYAFFFVRDLLDKLVHDENTIKEAVNYPIVGAIPTWGNGEAAKKKISTFKKGPVIAVRNYEDKLLSPDSPFFVTEAFNTLRTNFIYSAAATKNPVFAITSESAGVGKTVISSNLALALANMGKRVLLVESDMRCPSFNKVFGEKPEHGLSELLAGIVSDTKSVVHSYKETTLDVIFCGQIPPNPSELLSGYRMQELLDEWKGTYDYILLDMPPIGEVFDAGAVSAFVNGYILAVRCNYSNVNSVKGAVDAIESVNGNILGVIVNDIDPKSRGNHKYGYYEKNHDRQAF